MRASASLPDLLRQLAAWCDDAGDMVDGMSRDAFLLDKKTQYATSKCIEGIGEVARRILQDHPQFAAARAELPLAEIYRMRNRLAHGYDRVALDVVWESATRDAPELAALVRTVLAARPIDEP
jgi:uncharacterized protein with HEPN domain